MADRLLHHHAGALVDDADLLEAAADRAEQQGRDGEVEHPDGVLVAGPVLEQAVQDVPVVGRGDVERDVVEAVEEPVDGDRVEVVGATWASSASATSRGSRRRRGRCGRR